MSETEPVLEPVPVTKEAPAVNGNDDDLELPPPDPELQNGVNKHNGDMEVENGDVENYGLNGDKVEQSAPVSVPVNGGYEGTDDAEDNDIEGVDELPPPPEIVPDLPPPPEVCEQPPGENQDPFESSVDPAVESSVDPAVESSVDPDQDVGEIDCVDENEDLMNVSDSECPDESVPPPCVEPPRPVDDVSEEELVSDGGLKEEVDVEIQNNQQNESVEQMNEGQLVDVSEQVPQDIEPVPVQEVEPVDQVSPPMEPSAPLIDVGEPAYEPECPAEPVVSPASPMESEIPDIPVVPVVPEVAVEPEVQPVSEPEVETLPEPVPVVEVASPEPAPVIEDPAPEPEVDDSVFEPPSEPEVPVSQPEPVVVVEPEVPRVQEPEPVQIQEPVAAPVIPQIGLSEPDIIIDNKPVEQEVEQPPPPPPPLEEETPVPPPPLDDNIPLRRVSGSSSPNKQSPSKELDSPVALTAPVSVAVVAPQPEPIEPEPEVQVAQEPVPVPEPVSPPSYSKEEPVVQPPTQPIAVVAPQMVSDNVSPGSSPPASPGATSQTSPSEGDKAEAQPVTSPQVSQKINKKNFKNKIKFGIDLVEATLKQLNFLHSVNKHPGLYEEWLFRKAIRRYESFWLPMAAQHKKESLAAPLDIEWVWHCHMLAPLAYEADCKALVGLVVEHKVMNEKDRTKSLEKSRKYWTAKYPNEPFEIELVYKEKVVEPEPVPEPVTADTNQDKPNDTMEEKPDENTGEDVKEADTTEEAPVTEDAAPTSDDNNTTTEPAAPVEPVSAEPTPAPEPVEPVIPEEGYEQKTTYNIYSAIGRQRVFYYQTCLSHYHDKHFLKAAQKRYQRFLFLKHQNPLEFLVPCYDIDVMWHSHQLHPSVYKHDTVKVLGQILAHDDSVNDRSAGSRLVSADQRTRELWKEHFGDNFMTFGAMFRGDPPVLCERMSVIEPVETYTFSTKKATVNLDKVQVEGLPEEVNKYSVKLAYEGYDEKEGPMIKQLKGNKKKIEFENAKKGLAHFVFDTKEYERIRFDMHQHMGFACAGHDEEIGQQIFHLMPVVENIPMNKEDASNLVDTVTIDDEHNLKATFTATIEPPKQGPTMLYMNPGNYEQRFCIMPEQIVQMWGPVPLPRLPTGKDNNCLVASHKLVNHTGEVTFTCRVIHSLPLLMSAIQVFFHARMTAVAHLVGSDQIPLPSQLSEPKKVFSLNPGDDQRALVIKNQHGDWGLIRGQWTGFRKHQPAVAATKGKKAKKEVPWSPGTLSVSFYKCSSGAWQHLTLPYAQENFRFNIQEASIDLKTGTIEIQSESNEVAENLALGFSVALLHVLCQPRYQPPAPPEPIPVTVEPPPPSPKEPEAPKTEEEKPTGEPATQEGAEGESSEATKPAEAEEEKPQEPPATPKTPKSPAKSEPPTPSKKVKEVPPIPTCELGLVLAAGFNVDTPTTEHIKRQYGANACAGCCAVGVDIGVGIYGNVADAEVMEAAEGGDVGDVDNVAGDNGDAGDQDVGSGGEGGDIDTDAAGMDCMGDIGDAGAAACGAF